MQRHARDTYQDSQIVTASPQRLRLMLIEGALRFGRAALANWSTQRDEAAHDAVVRVREIISELLTGVCPDGSDLAKAVLDLYGFLLQHVTEAQFQRDQQKLQDVLDVLETERETWRQVCVLQPESLAPPCRVSAVPQEISAGHLPAIPPSSSPVSSGFSLDA